MSEGSYARDILKLEPPKFDGSRSKWHVWRKEFGFMIKGLPYNLDAMLTSEKFFGLPKECDETKVQVLKKTIETYKCSMRALRATLVKCLPTELVAKLVTLPAWTRKDAIEGIDIKPATMKELDLPEVLDDDAHVATMFKYLCREFEATTTAERRALWGKLESVK